MTVWWYLGELWLRGMAYKACEVEICTGSSQCWAGQWKYFWTPIRSALCDNSTRRERSTFDCDLVLFLVSVKGKQNLSTGCLARYLDLCFAPETAPGVTQQITLPETLAIDASKKVTRTNILPWDSANSEVKHAFAVCQRWWVVTRHAVHVGINLRSNL